MSSTSIIKRKYTSRKWHAFWAGFVVANMLIATGVISGGEWITFMTLIYGIASGASVWEKNHAIANNKEVEY